MRSQIGKYVREKIIRWDEDAIKFNRALTIIIPWVRSFLRKSKREPLENPWSAYLSVCGKSFSHLFRPSLLTLPLIILSIDINSNSLPWCCSSFGQFSASFPVSLFRTQNEPAFWIKNGVEWSKYDRDTDIYWIYSRLKRCNTKSNK